MAEWRTDSASDYYYEDRRIGDIHRNELEEMFLQEHKRKVEYRSKCIDLEFRLKASEEACNIYKHELQSRSGVNWGLILAIEGLALIVLTSVIIYLTQ